MGRIRLTVFLDVDNGSYVEIHRFVCPSLQDATNRITSFTDAHAGKGGITLIGWRLEQWDEETERINRSFHRSDDFGRSAYRPTPDLHIYRDADYNG